MPPQFFFFFLRWLPSSTRQPRLAICPGGTFPFSPILFFFQGRTRHAACSFSFFFISPSTSSEILAPRLPPRPHLLWLSDPLFLLVFCRSPVYFPKFFRAENFCQDLHPPPCRNRQACAFQPLQRKTRCLFTFAESRPWSFIYLPHCVLLSPLPLPSYCGGYPTDGGNFPFSLLFFQSRGFWDPASDPPLWGQEQSNRNRLIPAFFS